MRPSSRGLAIAVLTILLAVAPLGSAMGYIEQRLSQVLLSGPNVVRCNNAATVSATVVSTEDGKPIANQIVRWSLGQALSGGDGLSAASTITNRRGRTGVTVTFGPVAGARVVQAAIAGGSPGITIRCAGGLPRTATLPPPGWVTQPSATLLAPPPPTVAAVGDLPATRLRLERLGIDLPLVEGDGVSVPEHAAAHYPGTAWPGEGSNTYVYAHAREGHFLELWQVRRGDRVHVDMADDSTAIYEVTDIHPVVAWDALEYLAPSDTEVLTLQTCLTYADTAPRFVVIAEPLAQA